MGYSNNNSGFIAHTLKMERKKVMMTQAQLASATGLGLKTIRKVEQGDQSVTMKKINRAFNFFGLELGPKNILTSPHSEIKSSITQDEILEILAGIHQIFKLKFGVTRLGLFGSFARGDSTGDSDIDIIFEGDTDLPGEGQMTLILEHLFLGHKIDYTNGKNLDSRLKESILDDVIYV